MTIETLTLIERTLWASAAIAPLAIGLWKAFEEWRESRAGVFFALVDVALERPRAAVALVSLFAASIGFLLIAR